MVIVKRKRVILWVTQWIRIYYTNLFGINKISTVDKHFKWIVLIFLKKTSVTKMIVIYSWNEKTVKYYWYILGLNDF